METGSGDARMSEAIEEVNSADAWFSSADEREMMLVVSPTVRVHARSQGMR